MILRGQGCSLAPSVTQTPKLKAVDEHGTQASGACEGAFISSDSLRSTGTQGNTSPQPSASFQSPVAAKELPEIPHCQCLPPALV